LILQAKPSPKLPAEIRSVIDIGGQDSKAISIDENGGVKNFAMNDKCAAGTGRFLEVMANALQLELEDFGKFSLNAEHPSKISSLCTVFAESEVISLISKGEKRENIIAGIHESIASRVVAMSNRVGMTAPIMMTGGVAKNIGVHRGDWSGAHSTEGLEGEPANLLQPPVLEITIRQWKNLNSSSSGGSRLDISNMLCESKIRPNLDKTMLDTLFQRSGQVYLSRSRNKRERKKGAYHALLIVLPKTLGPSTDMCPTGGSIFFATPAIV
jgi:hypothetical protein